MRPCLTFCCLHLCLLTAGLLQRLGLNFALTSLQKAHFGFDYTAENGAGNGSGNAGYSSDSSSAASQLAQASSSSSSSSATAAAAAAASVAKPTAKQSAADSASSAANPSQHQQQRQKKEQAKPREQTKRGRPNKFDKFADHPYDNEHKLRRAELEDELNGEAEDWEVWEAAHRGEWDEGRELGFAGAVHQASRCGTFNEDGCLNR